MTTTTKKKKWTVNDIKTTMRAAGSHWFDPGAMRFFGTKVLPTVYQGPGGIYFVTSEQPPHGPRMYCVRQFFPGLLVGFVHGDFPNKPDIHTVGELASLRETQAKNLALVESEESLDTKITRALLALDQAITGNNKATAMSQYGSCKDIAEGEIIYLSDGGYTRCNIHQYHDSSGYYLQLIETGATDRKPAWNDSYKLQQEVCRVVQTYWNMPPEKAETSHEWYKDVTDLEQFIKELREHGTLAGADDEYMQRAAINLIVLSKRFDNQCVAECNGTGKRSEVTKQFIEQAARECGAIGVIFSGDPRGCVVKLVFQDGATNDWGHEGWCVPYGD